MWGFLEIFCIKQAACHLISTDGRSCYYWTDSKGSFSIDRGLLQQTMNSIFASFYFSGERIWGPSTGPGEWNWVISGFPFMSGHWLHPLALKENDLNMVRSNQRGSMLSFEIFRTFSMVGARLVLPGRSLYLVHLVRELTYKWSALFQTFPGVMNFHLNYSQ